MNMSSSLKWVVLNLSQLIAVFIFSEERILFCIIYITTFKPEENHI
jgi:hypothetical protein